MLSLLFTASDTFATFIVKECKVFKRIIPCLFLLSAAAVAADKPTLTVYTYDSFAADWGPGRRLKKPLKPSVIASLNLWRWKTVFHY